MAPNITTDVAFRRSRHRSNTTAGAFENSIIAVEPNKHPTRGTLRFEISPVEKGEDVLFAVSLDADGIWRVKQFNEAFAKLFGVPHGSHSDVRQYRLSLAFATPLAN